jgi:rhamnulokinase
VLGPLAPDVVEETGLSGSRLVAPATHDTASAVAAVPFRASGSAYISAGTWSLVGVESPMPLIDDRTYAANLTNEGGVGGAFRVLRNVAGLWLLQECRREWARQGREFSYDELLARAAEAPPLQALVDPDDAAFAEPGDMPARIRAVCVRGGQPPPEEPGAVARCLLESLALKHAHVLELVREATGLAPTEVHVVGGGARNELLCRWTAEAAGLPVLAGPVEATAVGNLLVQAMALGELATLAEARDVVRASFAPTVHEPQDAERWREARERFEELVAAPRPREEVQA